MAIFVVRDSFRITKVMDFDQRWLLCDQNPWDSADDSSALWIFKYLDSNFCISFPDVWGSGSNVSALCAGHSSVQARKLLFAALMSSHEDEGEKKHSVFCFITISQIHNCMWQKLEFILLADKHFLPTWWNDWSFNQSSLWWFKNPSDKNCSFI